MPDIPSLAQARRGTTSKGVPFVALPPEEGREAEGLIVLWHGGDPPRTEEALAAAVPMSEVPAWRVYLGMPLSGQRLPAGGFEEIVRRGTEDAVTLLFHPIIAGAVAELPGAVGDLRSQLRINSGLPLGIFGFSQGGAAALLAVSRQVLPFKAAVTFGAVVEMTVLIDALALLYNAKYEWNEERRGLAAKISAAHRAHELVKSETAILLAIGADDPYPVREPLERLATAIQVEGGMVETRVVSNVGHAFVDEPGDVAAAQGPQARAVDELACRWFSQRLV
jgi:dienelactone hydrolase